MYTNLCEICSNFAPIKVMVQNHRTVLPDSAVFPHVTPMGQQMTEV